MRFIKSKRHSTHTERMTGPTMQRINELWAEGVSPKDILSILELEEENN